MLGTLQQQKLDHLFQIVDRDRSGALEFSDLEGLMQKLLAEAGQAPGSPVYEGAEVMLRQLWEALKGIADTDGDSRISREEWTRCWAQQLDGELDVVFEDLPAIVRQIHLVLAQAMGINEARGASLDVYRRFLSAYGEAVAKEAASAFSRLDLDGNGTISSDELRQLTAEFFLSDDAEAPGNALFG